MVFSVPHRLVVMFQLPQTRDSPAVKTPELQRSSDSLIDFAGKKPTYPDKCAHSHRRISRPTPIQHAVHLVHISPPPNNKDARVK